MPPAAAALTHGAIEPGGQLNQGHGVGGQSVQTGLNGGHQQPCRDPFARDVGDDQQQAGIVCVGPRKSVVVIAGDGVGRFRAERNIEAGKRGRSLWEQHALDVARDLQVAFEAYAIGQLKHQQRQQDQGGGRRME